MRPAVCVLFLVVSSHHVCFKLVESDIIYTHLCIHRTLSRSDGRWALQRCMKHVLLGEQSSAVHHLVRQGDGGAVDEGALLVSSFQEVGEQLPFALHKDGSSLHEAEAIFLQDVVAVLHHLEPAHSAVRHASRGHSLTRGWTHTCISVPGCCPSPP